MTSSNVLIGEDEWLFLREGSNRSYSYLTGSEPIDQRTAMKWKQTIAIRKRIFSGCLHLICPEKLAVFPEFAPGTTLDENRLASALGRQNDVIYPVTELAKMDVEYGASYSKTDTHFNDLGALRTARAVLTELGIDAAYTPEWGKLSILGDLGMNVEPKIRSDKIILKNPPSVASADNGLRNRGRMISFQNEAGANGRLLIFGDSFSGINLARMFANFVQNVLFVHSLSADYRIVQKYEPNFLLFQLAERFLRDIPWDGSTVEKLLVEKMILEPANIAAVAEWRADSDNPTSSFVDWPLVDFLMPDA